MDTEDFINSLARNLPPVRRATPPLKLLLNWSLITAPVLAMVVWAMGPRPDLSSLITQRHFLQLEILALVTALVSAYAAFCAGRPDEPVWKLWLPVTVFGIWLGELGRQCVVLSIQTKGAALGLQPDFMCIPAIAITGVIPAIVMVWFLRRSAAFRLSHACLYGAMAAAAAAEVALPLFHAADTVLMVLVWQMGSVLLFTLLAAISGRFALNRKNFA